MFAKWLGTKAFILNALIWLVVISISLIDGKVLVAALTAISMVCGLVTWYEYRCTLANM